MHKDRTNEGQGCTLFAERIREELERAMRLLSVPTRSSAFESRTSSPQDRDQEAQGDGMVGLEALVDSSARSTTTGCGECGRTDRYSVSDYRFVTSPELDSRRANAGNEAHQSLVSRNANVRGWDGPRPSFWDSLLRR